MPVTTKPGSATDSEIGWLPNEPERCCVMLILVRSFPSTAALTWRLENAIAVRRAVATPTAVSVDEILTMLFPVAEVMGIAVMIWNSKFSRMVPSWMETISPLRRFVAGTAVIDPLAAVKITVWQVASQVPH
jgi:hypothetical protein